MKYWKNIDEYYKYCKNNTKYCRNMMKYSSQEPSSGDGGNYIVKAVNGVGEKECTLALNFGGGAEDEENISIFRKIFHNLKIFQENVPARIYEQPLLLQPNPSTLILEAHIHANPKPKVDF